MKWQRSKVDERNGKSRMAKEGKLKSKIRNFIMES
jgi:hypothetical protein